MNRFLGFRARKKLAFVFACALLAGFLAVNSSFLEETEIVAQAASSSDFSGTLAAGTYNMTANMTLSNYCTIAANTTVTINGNGYTITGAEDLTIFYIGKGAHLILNNVNLQYNYVDGVCEDYTKTDGGYKYVILNYGTLNMNGGSLDGSTRTNSIQGIHGAITVTSETILDGVEISNCSYAIGTYGIVSLNNCSIHDVRQGIHLNGSSSYSTASYATITDSSLYNATQYAVNSNKLKNGTLTITNSSIENCSVAGVIVQGSVTGDDSSVEIADTKISNCGTGVKLSESGCSSLTFSGNDIYENTNGIVVDTSDTVYYTSGSTHSNDTYGVQLNSSANLVFSGGSISSNGCYDIYHEGESLKISGSASCEGTEGIYLCADKYVEITSALSCEEGAFSLSVDGDDATVGRKMTLISYTATANARASIRSKFTLTNECTTTTSETLLPNDTYYRTAVLRAGNGNNGGNAYTQVISEEYYIYFESTVLGSHVSVETPETIIVYWKETGNFTLDEAVMYYDGTQLWSFSNSGWNLAEDLTGTSLAVGSTLYYAVNASDSYYLGGGRYGVALSSTRDYTLYAMWDVSANINVCGNSQTEGDDYTIAAFVSGVDVLPENTFKRLDTCEYSFQGWSLSTDATYLSEGVYQEGDTFEFEELLIAWIEAGLDLSVTEGYIDIPVYVVWDAFPQITAKTIYLTRSQVNNGITEEELLLMWLLLLLQARHI